MQLFQLIVASLFFILVLSKKDDQTFEAVPSHSPAAIVFNEPTYNIPEASLASTDPEVSLASTDGNGDGLEFSFWDSFSSSRDGGIISQLPGYEFPPLFHEEIEQVDTYHQPREVRGDGRCGIRSVLHAISTLGISIDVVDDDGSLLVLDPDIDLRWDNTPSTLRFFAAHLRVLARANLEWLMNEAAEDVRLHEINDTVDWVSHLLSSDLEVEFLDMSLWVNERILQGATSHFGVDINVFYADEGAVRPMSAVYGDDWQGTITIGYQDDHFDLRVTAEDFIEFDPLPQLSQPSQLPQPQLEPPTKKPRVSLNLDNKKEMPKVFNVTGRYISLSPGVDVDSKLRKLVGYDQTDAPPNNWETPGMHRPELVRLQRRLLRFREVVKDVKDEAGNHVNLTGASIPWHLDSNDTHDIVARCLNYETTASHKSLKGKHCARARRSTGKLRSNCLDWLKRCDDNFEDGIFIDIDPIPRRYHADETEAISKKDHKFVMDAWVKYVLLPMFKEEDSIKIAVCAKSALAPLVKYAFNDNEEHLNQFHREHPGKLVSLSKDKLLVPAHPEAVFKPKHWSNLETKAIENDKFHSEVRRVSAWGGKFEECHVGRDIFDSDSESFRIIQEYFIEGCKKGGKKGGTTTSGIRSKAEAFLADGGKEDELTQKERNLIEGLRKGRKKGGTTTSGILSKAQDFLDAGGKEDELTQKERNLIEGLRKGRKKGGTTTSGILSKAEAFLADGGKEDELTQKERNLVEGVRKGRKKGGKRKLVGIRKGGTTTSGMKTQATKNEKKWNDTFQELVKYGRAHGHVNVPQSYGPLGRWVMIQRRDKNTMNRKRVKQLDSIGFVWSVGRGLGDTVKRVINNEKKWNDRFQELVRYGRAHGHVNVPQRYGPLGRWVNKQREMKKANKLDSDKIQRLDELNFNW